MNDTSATQQPWGHGRRGSDASPVKLDDLYAALKRSGPYDPQPVALDTHGFLLFDEDQGTLVPDEVTIHVFMTAIRAVMQPDFEFPEWEFEGWVKDDKPERTWLRGVLRVITDEDSELECGLYRLAAGEEWGDSPTPGFS